MLLREKINLVVPGKFSGRACFPAWRDFRRGVSTAVWTQSQENQISLARTFDRRASSPELHGVIGILKTIRQRILANTLLRGWTKWFVWILIGLIAVAAVSARLAGALLLIAVLAAAGAAAVMAWTWRNRPSHYETARRLDSAAGLQDRISTAVYLGGVADADGMIGEQRKDALARLVKVDPRGFFPVQLPGNIRRASVLALVAVGLFAYRIHHQPPLISLLQTTARSQLVQSILSPLAHALEKDVQRTIALVTTKPDAAAEEARRQDSTSNSEDLWKAPDEKSAEGQKESSDAVAGDQQQDQLQAPGRSGRRSQQRSTPG